MCEVILPGDRKATLLVFWDYDTQWGGDRSRSGGGPKSWGALEFVETERLLEIHAHYRIPACFAVVGAAALPGSRPYHDPQQVRRIHAAGHEVGSHSFNHDWLPGMSRTRLLDDLRRSKQALEDCIGAEVISFVPPYNQPRDYPQRLSISLSERREAGRVRSSLPQLCECLYESGFRFARVSYRPLWSKIADLVQGKRRLAPIRLESIAGVTCVRTNTEGGFADSTQNLLDRCVDTGGIVVAMGHPHSLSGASSQGRQHLERLLVKAAGYRDRGLLDICLPAQLLSARREVVMST